MQTNEVIDRIFKEPGIKFGLTEFENIGKPIHDIITIYRKIVTAGKAPSDIGRRASVTRSCPTGSGRTRSV